jgi:hypothetical protein
MLLPSDTLTSDWQAGNLQKWSNTDLLQLAGRDTQGNPYHVQLAPLEAKALHVVGVLVRTFNAAGHMLYFGDRGPKADFYLQAYLLACSAIELLARCKGGHEDLTVRSNDALREGLRIIGLERVGTGVEEYDLDKLVALRNLAAHGHGIASSRGRSIDVVLHVELLNGFPERLAGAFDDYYLDLFGSPDPETRKNLARAGVEPVLYSSMSGQVFISAIKDAHNQICLPHRRPSEVLEHTDWQVYDPGRGGEW